METASSEIKSKLKMEELDKISLRILKLVADELRIHL